MVSALISRIITLLFGTLYPAYRSYKAIKNKDVREYVKWMMYWIVFAFFVTGETFADMLLSWLPLYYEIKIVFIIWLLSPATKGSSIIYRKFVHPRLVKHEKAIDQYIAKAQSNSYATMMDLGRKGLNVATDTLVKTAVTGQHQLVQTLRKYNSMQDLNAGMDNTDSGERIVDKRATWYEGMPTNFNPDDDFDVLQKQYQQQRSISSTITEEPIETNDDNGSLKDSSQTIDDMDIREDRTDHSEINYAYSSNTLPRAKKARKPLYETMPNNTTRSRRRAATDKTSGQ